MKDVFARLGADFFSTIVFIAIYLATDNVLLATGVAIAGAIGQVIYSRIKGKELGYMTWASLGLVIVLGGATLLTHDPRFVLAKPAIGHFAIGLIMLKRGLVLELEILHDLHQGTHDRLDARRRARPISLGDNPIATAGHP